jgi:hypothetical protein
MAMKLLDTIYNKVSPYFRKKRMEQFLAEFQIEPATSLLDVGGYAFCWWGIPKAARITLLNPHMFADPEYYKQPYQFVVGDGRRLGYRDKSFDIVYSNSVIEHLSTFESQVEFANEARRVGKNLWIQTPARSFIIEPHLLTPLIHYLPRAKQKTLVRHFTLWGWLTRPTKRQAEDFIDEIRLLSYEEMRELFPDCEIRCEKFCGLTKSYIAVRRCG